MIAMTSIMRNGVGSSITLVRCDSCGASHTWGLRKGTGSSPSASLAAAMLRRDGWKMGKRHECRKCVDAARTNKVKGSSKCQAKGVRRT